MATAGQRPPKTPPFSAIAPPYPADDGLMLNLLARWVTDPAIRKKILVDNPARVRCGSVATAVFLVIAGEAIQGIANSE